MFSQSPSNVTHSMIKLKLMADYQCFPLWKANPDELGNVDPSVLPISSSLQQALLDWARTFDATLNLDDPINSGFQSAADELKFKEHGKTLGQRLQNELGAAYQVTVVV